MSRLRLLVRTTVLYPHFGTEHFLRKRISDYSRSIEGGRLLDIGCGERPYERYSNVEKYLGAEIAGGAHPDTKKKVDFYYDGRNLPIRTASVDWILSSEVLEHVNEPDMFIKEMNRVIKDGGEVILSTPQTWGLHEEPFDYYRYTKYGLKYLFEKNGFKIIKSNSTTGLMGTIGQRLSSHMFGLSSKKTWRIFAAFFLCLPIQLVTMFLDFLFGYGGDTIDNVVLAKKTELS